MTPSNAFGRRSQWNFNVWCWRVMIISSASEQVSNGAINFRLLFLSDAFLSIITSEFFWFPRGATWPSSKSLNITRSAPEADLLKITWCGKKINNLRNMVKENDTWQFTNWPFLISKSPTHTRPTHLPLTEVLIDSRFALEVWETAPPTSFSCLCYRLENFSPR